MGTNHQPKKTIWILGGGVSGGSASRLLREKGYQTLILDKKPKGNVESDQLDWESYPNPSQIIKSPGVKPDHPLLEQARKRNIPILSELELGFRYWEGFSIGITGTDGKSTVTTLTQHLVAFQNPSILAGGNLGTPITTLIQTNPSALVLEASSYQLEDSKILPWDISCFLNLAPDHLDRHKTMENYFLAKLRIRPDLKKGIFIVSDSLLKQYPRLGEDFHGTMQRFGDSKDCDAYIKDNFIYTKEYNYNTTHFPLSGRHNLMNLSASILIAEGMKIAPKTIQERLESFEGLPHRFKTFHKTKDLIFINDSKSTNVHSCMAGLSGFNKKDPLLLVIGGKPKDESLEPLIKRIKELECSVCIFGDASKDWPLLFPKGIVVHSEPNLEKTVEWLSSQSFTPGTTILFSPAAPSFDLFKNFEERGDRWEALIREKF
jgi:UDP-N-acetylmuramoylalanine--D-glutamate ligase